jgi:hypothetical protein
LGIPVENATGSSHVKTSCLFATSRACLDVGIENTGIEKKTQEWGKCVVVKNRGKEKRMN